MELQLIKGSFELNEAVGLITKLVETKIRYLENKISKHYPMSEEDMKMVEKRIIELQNHLKKLREQILQQNKSVEINATITVT
jgi:uncharacterized membrane protein YgaE (UPF0421/DUF939 family)